MSARTLALTAAVAVLASLAFAAVAGAATYPVSGKQIVTNEEKGEYRMIGGLVGKWETTSFKELPSGKYFRAKGTEKFKGCIDVKGDHKCAGDPTGTLSFRFLYWGMFGPGDALVWGSCWHPVIAGTGDFAGAQGVLTMVDTPTAAGVETRYTGNITIGAAPAARAAANARPHC